MLAPRSLVRLCSRPLASRPCMGCSHLAFCASNRSRCLGSLTWPSTFSLSASSSSSSCSSASAPPPSTSSFPSPPLSRGVRLPLRRRGCDFLLRREGGRDRGRWVGVSGGELGGSKGRGGRGEGEEEEEEDEEADEKERTETSPSEGVESRAGRLDHVDDCDVCEGDSRGGGEGAGLALGSLSCLPPRLSAAAISPSSSSTSLRFATSPQLSERNGGLACSPSTAALTLFRDRPTRRGSRRASFACSSRALARRRRHTERGVVSTVRMGRWSTRGTYGKVMA